MALLLSLLFVLPATAKKRYKLVEIETTMGTMKVRLYEDTPLHSENFLKFAADHHYDSLLFHRVIKDFMIQGGASDSRNAPAGAMVGMAELDYMLDAEIRPVHFHAKGALAAARQGDDVNPEKKSSPEQFYIVQGKVWTDEELDNLQKRKVFNQRNRLGSELYKPLRQAHQRYLREGKQVQADSLVQSINAEIERRIPDDAYAFSPEAREMYKSVGGSPHLDGDYTVFGEVVEGLDVLDKIAAVKTDRNDRPEEDVVILRMRLRRK